MIKLKYLTLATLLMAIPIVDFSQNQGECYNTVSFCPTHKKDGFTKNMQSLSGAFEQGDTSIVQIIVYKNMEYRISLCSPSNPDLQGLFQFKLAEDVTKGSWKQDTTYVKETSYDDDGEEVITTTPQIVKKRLYETIEEIRYDNADHEMSQDFIFQSQKTRKLKVKVYIPKSEEEEMSSGLSGSSYTCVGLLIEHQPGVSTGFNR
tara:strand:- start:2101 stop:2715 length:615 start_codon:yes stop_codon:yes gene_type:complete